MAFKLGLERIFSEKQLSADLAGKRLALVAHPASVDRELRHAIDLFFVNGLPLACAFGPQHGLKGDKQDNMIESADDVDPRYGIPIFSLYGEVRRPTAQMMTAFDIALIDLQDVGCRIYTFLTTLFYLLEESAKYGKQVWVLDRPNPVGRTIEGSLLRMQFTSFVGAAPVPMQHGLTLAEAALWYRQYKKLNVDIRVIAMTDYDPHREPWPEQDLTWIHPSPNMPRLSTARVYPGTVLVEGTLLSEGRGTTLPLEVVGTPQLDVKKVIETTQIRFHPWTRGLRLREMFFEPTFHKFKGELISAVHLVADNRFHRANEARPYRLVAAILKVIRQTHPQIAVWRLPPYEYETVKMPFDILSGSDFLRQWIENPNSTAEDLDHYLVPDEHQWGRERQPFLLYS